MDVQRTSCIWSGTDKWLHSLFQRKTSGQNRDEITDGVPSLDPQQMEEIELLQQEISSMEDER